MAVKHLSDEQIQDFLDGNLQASEKSLKKHLQSCSVCRKTWSYYQNLYSGLKKEPEFKLPSNFAHTVISRLPQMEKAQARFQFSDIFISITGIAALLGALIYFIDIKIFADLIAKISSLVSTAKNLTALNGGLMILGLAGLTLLFTATLDWLLVEPRSKKLAR